MARGLALHPARVERQAEEPFALAPAPQRELRGLVDVARFGDVVFDARGGVDVVVEVVHRHAVPRAEELGALGGDPDDADAGRGRGLGRLCQEGPQQVGEEEGAEAVGAELEFVALGAEAALRGHGAAGVVEEDVEAGVFGEEAVGGGFDG